MNSQGQLMNQAQGQLVCQQQQCTCQRIHLCDMSMDQILALAEKIKQLIAPMKPEQHA